MCSVECRRFRRHSHGSTKARSHKDLFNRLFGPGDEHWKQNNVLKILSDWDQNNLPKIRYYIDCGDDDGLLDGNMQVHQIMRQKGIRHEFRVRDGGHSWTYWRTALPEVLRFVSQTFAEVDKTVILVHQSVIPVSCKPFPFIMFAT